MCKIVNYSHSSGCCRRCVASWFTVLSWHTVFTIWMIYKFTLVRYSAKQDAMHRPMTHLTHLYTVPFLWPWNEHKQQCSLVDDFTGQCWLWRLLSCRTFVVAALGLPTNLGVGWYWLFAASSIKFLTRWILKSRWVCLVPHEDNRIQLLRAVRSIRWKNSFVVHLKVCRLIE